ncbi:TPA: hypothetical protein U0Z67_000832 [Legionella pneumophila]|nr:hypothetical protein [Legionella pneumophila]
MTTPSHYSRTNLQRLLGQNKYFLYHWTTIDSTKSILNDGYLFSKAMLFGLHYHTNPQLLKKLKQNDVISEAQNGFIDYVFLGNTNWIDYGYSSYGEVCFVIKPEMILLNREYFVFPFNTGRYFLSHNDDDKTCDTRTLMEGLKQTHPCFEILVRRRIKISEHNIDKIICPEGYRESINHSLLSKKLNIKVEGYSGLHNMKEQESIELFDPLDTEKKTLIFNGNEYMRYQDHVYVKTKYSNCILNLKVTGTNELIDAITNQPVGKIISKHEETNIRGRSLEP